MKDSLPGLQNGTDIRGIALENDVRPVNMTNDDIRAIAGGILRWLMSRSNNKTNTLRIAIGMDSRVTGPKIKELLMEEFSRHCVSIVDCGLATTPAIFMTTIWEEYSCNCGIMITASHLPYYYNGLKIFTSAGATERSDIREILTFASECYDSIEETEGRGQVRTMELLEDYSNHLVRNIIKATGMSKPLEGMRVIVDAGNGSGGFFASKVLATLGADTTGSRFLDPDGMFPNHEPNPENKEAMESISSAVLKHHADLGIIFDTDVDRAAIVTDDGMEVNRNSLIALISDIVLREHPGSVIVTDSITSDGLTEFIHRRGGIHHRFKRGYKNVINEAKRINAEGERISCLAIETSGHAALAENHFLDDGTYLIAKLLIEASRLHQEGKKLQSLIQDLKRPQESVEYRIGIVEPDFKAYGEGVLERFRTFAQSQNGWDIVSPNFEGVKVNVPSGWILMRMSLHEPVMPVNIELENGDLLGEVIDKLKDFVKEQHGLDF
ncbi:MAG: phosphomannomutase/phosphoglucomutase [Peptostreptococcaceae bacterium]|nr:phosphomannomutase/phosphoglucomutase [Peptostreptococcaceae bacterium]